MNLLLRYVNSEVSGPD